MKRYITDFSTVESLAAEMLTMTGVWVPSYRSDSGRLVPERCICSLTLCQQISIGKADAIFVLSLTDQCHAGRMAHDAMKAQAMETARELFSDWNAEGAA